MKLIGAAGAVALLLINTARASILPRNHDANDYFALHLDPSVSPLQIAQLLGATHEGQVGELADHHTFSRPKGRPGSDLGKTLDDLKLRRRRRKRDVSHSSMEDPVVTDVLDGILWSQKLTLRPPMVKRAPPPPPPTTAKTKARQSKPQVQEDEGYNATERLRHIATTLEIEDPIFADQWHLFNTVEVGHDLNVTGLWLEGITGEGVISAIVDDGLDMNSNDLMDNYFAEGSYDYNDKSPVPKPRLFDDKHGTRCAGEIAAVRNNVCGVGVAYDSKVSGIRILSKPVTDEDEAASINYKYQHNQIYSCSWGPIDDGATMDAPGILIRRALVNGIQKGRAGRGSIYVFAAGNGAGNEDNCNFDGYTNSIYSVTVGAVDRDDNHPYYSEWCSAQLVVTYSSGANGAIHTTDVGVDSCATRHGGTSAAGPLVAGVVALALSVRPELTWRDVQYILLETAIPVHLNDSDWQETSIGKQFSHEFGYGKVDAYSAVHLAKEWKLVKPQAWMHSPWQQVNHPIPQGETGLASSFEVTKKMLDMNNIERIEHVTLTMNVNHTRRGDLSVELHSPSGVVSLLSTTRKNDDHAVGYVDWTFMSVAHWGESGIGEWTVIVKDTIVNEHNGTFIDWQLNLWGEAINPKIQELHPLPTENDHDHDTEPAVVTTTPITTPGGPSRPTPTSIPSDGVDRPVNAKPTDSTSASGPDDHDSANPSKPDSFLPSFFPTFGVSKRTQVWIYGSLTLILIFCAALGVYFLVQRRKRLRNNPRDDYEFEMIDGSDDTDPLNGGGDDDGDGAGHMGAGGVGRLGRKQRKKKGGELYDAFAGESDEDLLSDDGTGEMELSDSGSDGPYRDEEDDEKRVGGSAGSGGSGGLSEKT
ncbi:kexin [Blastomyces gilchristii SLH14081]|uniref:Kexin n=2 Tax=Blastomyces TaxID=229219 RepID=A0A179UFK2_BLAGS|nr:kexin [Blastomyces gilchristii SLH14081]EGE77626.1 kexin [Blastomyces dermatitidis ATCC 18188]EQL29794.1 kexin [Blastomyces dermatitidis ATCC 26199]OAT05927.1 kexin [Blastomyces gilchristii SLH14081]